MFVFFRFSSRANIVKILKLFNMLWSIHGSTINSPIWPYTIIIINHFSSERFPDLLLWINLNEEVFRHNWNATLTVDVDVGYFNSLRRLRTATNRITLCLKTSVPKEGKDSHFILIALLLNGELCQSIVPLIICPASPFIM